MKSKKSRKANLENKRLMYLPLGLIIAGSISLVAFEWKVAGSKTKLEKVEHVADTYYEPNYVIDQPDQKKEIIHQPKTNNNPSTDPSQSSSVEARNITNVVQSSTQNNDLGDATFEDMFGSVNVSYGGPVDQTVDNYKLVNKAEFPGGMDAMYDFLRDNLVYPKIAVGAHITGTAHVEFIIGKDGKIESAKVVGNRVGGGCDEEAVRVVNTMPAWIPGEQYGVPVKFDTYFLSNFF